MRGKLALVDKDFFEMFHIEFIHGNKLSALNGLYDIIITEEMAKRYFGSEDPFGKTITVWPNYLFTVTGVIKNIPRNSHFYTDCIASFEFYRIIYGGNSDIGTFNDWNNVFNYTFIEIRKDVDNKLVEDKIRGIIQRNRNESNS